VVLYARSDLMSVSVPVTSGGCGSTHTRPVRDGVPARDFRLDCPGCEAYLKGGGRMILKTIPGDKENGIPQSQKRVADCDPCWGATPESVPSTPDEEQYTTKRNKLGAEELEWIRALAAARQAGIGIPDAAREMLQRRLPGFEVGTQVDCVNGHPNDVGIKFCGECGISMLAEKVEKVVDVDPPFEEPDDLSGFSIATLKSMCRQQNLPANGTKAQLIERLS
jgi:hypothetical protein